MLQIYPLLSITALVIFTTVILLNKNLNFMNAQDAIKKIKIMLGLEKFEATAKLVDGTEVYVEDEFVVGAQLSVITEDGLIPAPEGMHTLENGQQVTVDAAGVIVEISEASAEKLEEKEEEKEEMAKDDKEEDMAKDDKEEKMDEEITKDIVSEIVQAIAPLVDDLVQMKKDVEEMRKEFAKFSAEPAAKPVKNNFSATLTQTDKRMELLAQLRKQNKNKTK
jgi:hypothetical protein